MINWDEFEHIHVIRKLKEIISQSSSESRIMLSITTVLSVSAAVSVERLRPGQPKTEAMSTARAKINLRVTAELPS